MKINVGDLVQLKSMLYPCIVIEFATLDGFAYIKALDAQFQIIHFSIRDDNIKIINSFDETIS